MTKVINIFEAFSGGEFQAPSYFKVSGYGEDSNNSSVEVLIGNGENLLSLYLDGHKDSHAGFITGLQKALVKALEFNEEVSRMEPQTLEKVEGVLRSTETKVK